jgi:hypothetical protein
MKLTDIRRHPTKYPLWAAFNKYVIHSLWPTKGSSIEVIRDGCSLVVKNALKDVPEATLSNADFLVYSHTVEDGWQINKVLRFNLETPEPNYETCKFKFISMTIQVQGDPKEYALRLYNENENYFIVDNRLNAKLFCYLLRKQHGIVKNLSTSQYSIAVIDHHVTVILLNETDEIVLGLKDYSIRKYVPTS